MKDGEGNVGLIKHVTRRLEEFLHEHTPGRFQTVEEMQQAFSRWLRVKEVPASKFKAGDDMIAQEVHAEDIVDEHSATLAYVKFFDNGRVGIMWLPQLFTISDFLCDDLREDLVKLLRFHAKKMEDHSLDERMKECAGKMMGAA